MAYELQPLKRLSPIISYNDFDDVYVYIPYKKKNSSEYRNMVKNLGGHFDALKTRWYIKNNKLSDFVKDQIQKMNLYDGLKFVWRKPYKDMTNLSLTQKLSFLSVENVTPVVCKQINYSKNISVQYHSFKDKNFVAEIFVDNYYNQDYFNYTKDQIKFKILNFDILPIEYARSNWIHYSNRTKNIVNISETGIQKICDSFL